MHAAVAGDLVVLDRLVREDDCSVADFRLSEVLKQAAPSSIMPSIASQRTAFGF